MIEFRDSRTGIPKFFLLKYFVFSKELYSFVSKRKRKPGRIRVDWETHQKL